ncbi:MAG: hypothetical protein VR69_00845 [Peptococcaceae bacterium BRH_c4b]|nr:MAG: hypothetical protein VR69_00845 [Peptococcaceae bacterium BRH_c4b]
MEVKALEKPKFDVDQMISASHASKNFGEIRKRAKIVPQLITDNGTADTILMGYEYYELLYQRLMELEEKEEARILEERIERLEKDPSVAVSWREVRREV